MASETISLQVLPCGGLVLVSYGSADAGAWSVSRTSVPPDGSVGSTETLYSGPAPATSPQSWLDLGEGALPLDPATTYVYSITTATGSASAATLPAASLALEFFDLTEFVHRFIMAGIQNVTLPGTAAFVNKPTVIIAMPLTGTPSLPCVSVAEDLMQSAEQGIGHTVNSDFTRNRYDINQIMHRRMRIAVLCNSPEERGFYEALVISLFQAMLTTLGDLMGMNIRYAFQAASSQVVDQAPGFYFCEIGLEFDGTYRTTLTTSYPVMEGVGVLTMSGVAL